MSGPELSFPPGFVTRVTRAFGAEGTRWLEALPGLISDAAITWEIEVGPPLDLSYGYLAEARGPDGADLVLKAAFPDDEARRQIAALRAYDGQNACQLIAADEERCVLLLARIRPGNTLEAIARHDDEAATRIGASVMRALWRPVSEPSTFVGLETWFEAFSRYRARHGISGSLPAALLTHAEALAESLITSTNEPALLHGDLHHGNILDAGEGRWLAIDPKGVLGDRGYEVGPFLLNPLDLTLDAALLSRRLEVFAEMLAYDWDRLRDWGVAHATLSACWSIEDHGDWERAAHAATLLAGL